MDEDDHMTNSKIISEYRKVHRNTITSLLNNNAKICNYCKGFGSLDYWKDSVGNIYFTGKVETCHNCKGEGWKSIIDR